MKFSMFLAVVSLLLAVPSIANADIVTTKKGAPVCFTKLWIEDMIKFASVRDMGSYHAYNVEKKCIMLKEGVKVTVMKKGDDGIVEIMIKGVRLYTVQPALYFGEAN